MIPERVLAKHYLATDRLHPVMQNLRYPIVVEHRQRYEFAADIAMRGAVAHILDGASGSGWGAHYLATRTKATTVLGVDYDVDAIAEATAHFPADNLSFIRCDLLEPDAVTHLPQSDLLVSFETLEHFPIELAGVFLHNMATVVAKGGKMVISTPNGRLFSPYSCTEGKPWYPYHYKEYNCDEFPRVLEANGWTIESLWGQRFVNAEAYLKLAALVRPLREWGNRLGLPWDHVIRRVPFAVLQRYAAGTSSASLEQVNKHPTEPIYLIAVCTKS